MASEPLELLPPAAPLDGSELFYVVQNGSSRKISADELATFTGGGGTGGTGGTGTGKYNRTFRPQQVELPLASYAELTSRNSRPVLAFDKDVAEAAIWSDVLSPDYAAGGLAVDLFVALDTAVAGTVGFDLTIERTDANGLDIDADSFATAQVVAAVAVPAAAGKIVKLSATLGAPALDGLAAGELYRLRVRRDVANDTAASDAHLLMVQIREL